MPVSPDSSGTTQIPTRTRIPSSTSRPRTVSSSLAAPTGPVARRTTSSSSSTASSAAKTVSKTVTNARPTRKPVAPSPNETIPTRSAPQTPPSKSPLRPSSSSKPSSPTQALRVVKKVESGPSLRTPSSSRSLSTTTTSNETARSLSRKSSNVSDASLSTSRSTPSVSRLQPNSNSSLSRPSSSRVGSRIPSTSLQTPSSPSSRKSRSPDTAPSNPPSPSLRRPTSSTSAGTSARKPPPSLSSPSASATPSLSRLPRAPANPSSSTQTRRKPVPVPAPAPIAPQTKKSGDTPAASIPSRSHSQSSGRRVDRSKSRERSSSPLTPPPTTSPSVLPDPISTSSSIPPPVRTPTAPPSFSSSTPRLVKPLIISPPKLSLPVATSRAQRAERDEDIAMLSTVLNTAFGNQPIVPGALGQDIAEEMQARSVKSRSSSVSPSPSFEKDDKKDKKKTRNVLKRKPSQKEGLFSGLLRTPTTPTFRGSQGIGSLRPSKSSAPPASLTPPMVNSSPISPSSADTETSGSGGGNSASLSAVGAKRLFGDVSPTAGAPGTSTPIYETYRRPAAPFDLTTKAMDRQPKDEADPNGASSSLRQDSVKNVEFPSVPVVHDNAEPSLPGRDRTESQATSISALSTNSSDFQALRVHLNDSTGSTSTSSSSLPSIKRGDKRRGGVDFSRLGDLDDRAHGRANGFDMLQKLADTESRSSGHGEVKETKIADLEYQARRQSSAPDPSRPHTRRPSNESFRERMRTLSSPDAPPTPPKGGSKIDRHGALGSPRNLFHFHQHAQSTASWKGKDRESKDAMPYYTVLGATTGRVVAVGSPDDSHAWSGYTASGYVWDSAKGEYVKRDDTKAEGASTLKRSLSRKMSERWKKTEGGVVRSDDSPDGRPRRSLQMEKEGKGDIEKRGMRGSLRISLDKDRSAFTSASTSASGDHSSPSIPPPSVGTPANGRATALSSAASMASNIPRGLEPTYNQPRSRKSEPVGLSNAGGGFKIWKLVKRISTGGLRDKYVHDESNAPPVPALPKSYQAPSTGLPSLKGSDRHVERRRTKTTGQVEEPGDVRTKFLHSRPSMAAERPRPLPPTPMPVALPIGPASSSTTTPTSAGRPSTATVSSTFSSEKDRFGFAHKTSSTSSVGSSWGGTGEGDEDVPPPVPKVTYVPKHILPPSELHRMMSGSSTPSRKSAESPSQKSKTKAQEILGYGTPPSNSSSPLINDDLDWSTMRSPVEEKPSLPFPPQRTIATSTSKSSLTGHSSAGDNRPPSPTMPSFRTEGAINSFAPSSKKNSPETSSPSSRLPVPSKGATSNSPSTSPPPPRPSRSTSRPRPMSGASSTRISSPQSTTQPAVSETKPGRGRLRNTSRRSEDSAQTSPSGGAVSFREIPPLPDKFPLTEQEKNEKWNDLLQRTAGGTIHLGSTNELESDSLSGWID